MLLPKIYFFLLLDSFERRRNNEFLTMERQEGIRMIMFMIGELNEDIKIEVIRLNTNSG